MQLKMSQSIRIIRSYIENIHILTTHWTFYRNEQNIGNDEYKMDGQENIELFSGKEQRMNTVRFDELFVDKFK